MSNTEENEFLHFGDPMYSDATNNRIKKSTYDKSINTRREYSDRELNAHLQDKVKSPKTIRLNWKRRRQDRKDKKKLKTVKMKGSKDVSSQQSYENRGKAKSLGRNRLRSR